jgi:chromosomal replication initiation ATPase DnaA
MVHKGQPLTLIGDSVTGKSHLLMGLGAEADKRRPDLTRDVMLDRRDAFHDAALTQLAAG